MNRVTFYVGLGTKLNKKLYYHLIRGEALSNTSDVLAPSQLLRKGTLHLARQQRSRVRSIVFSDTIELIRNTRAGQEASMYGPLRDLFCEFLGYGRAQVLIDVAGEAGRPDLTCRAPSGIVDRNNAVREIDWIVVEAKDEHDAFSTSGKREAIFAQKSKYIRPDTAWFVMVDPTIIVARPVMSSELFIINDIELNLESCITEHDFKEALNKYRYS